MKAIFKPCRLEGTIDAPPSKSMAHRYLIGAALSGDKCTLTGVDYSEDILASIDCLRGLGAEIFIDGDRVSIDPCGFMKADKPVLECRESGSTLRFLIPLCLCLGREIVIRGSRRLMERPLGVYEELCGTYGFRFKRDSESINLCGNLCGGSYEIPGNVSSQFITGMIYALVYLGEASTIKIIPPFESRSYIDLTLEALKSFGFDVKFADEYRIEIKASRGKAFCGKIEGDYSNAAFLDAFNFVGSSVKVGNLSADSLQGDRVYAEYFEKIDTGVPTLNISDCPDLGPVLFALAALKNGATFLGTDRLRLKESDRGMAMQKELEKLGGGLVFGSNSITVPKLSLSYKGVSLDGHNDHRIVMAMSVILSTLGGEIDGVEAVKKSYPGFFDDIKALGAAVEIV